MNVSTLYAKLHCATCTESRLDYMGSVTIDQDWMDAAGLQDSQAVDVVNIDNGERLTTYAISGKRGLAKAYWESSKASGLGTLGWAIFLAKRQSS